MIILTTKLKNAIAKYAGKTELSYTLKNISINGVKRGCSGFIRNIKNGVVVYVNTEPTCLDSLVFMYRYADDEGDFKGYRNRWANTLDELTKEICKMLIEPSVNKEWRV